MTDELKQLGNIIGLLHNNSPDKKDRIPTQLMDKVFRDLKEAGKVIQLEEADRTAQYFENHLEVTSRWMLEIKLILKDLNAIAFLNAMDFYRLMRCKKIERELSALICFYKEQALILCLATSPG